MAALTRCSPPSTDRGSPTSSSCLCPWISRRSRGARSTGCPSQAIRGRKRPGQRRESLRRVSPGSCSERLASLRTPTTRDHPALDATSRLSPYLKVGALHPRTLLADLGPDDDAFRRELAWREFYAAVLHHRPSTARSCFQPHMEAMRYDHGSAADGRFAAWAAGRTGFPVGRRRDATAARRRLDAQPAQDDHCVVPREGPSHRLDSRCASLHGRT